jgi:hypothetical protein
MVLRGRRIVVAAVLVTAVLGALGLRPDSGATTSPEHPGSPATATLVDAGARDIGAAVARTSTSSDVDLAQWIGSSPTRVAGLAAAVATAGLAASLAWWRRRNRDRLLQVALRSWSLAARRAPPALL